MQRLGPPHWPSYPPGAAYGALYDRDRETGLAAARLGARLIAADLAALGIDVDCAPIADVPVAGADPIIGDRAYGTTPDKVAAIAGGDRRGPAGGRRPAGAQAHSRPRPRHRRQPRKAAGGQHRPGDARSHRFCRIPAAWRAAAGHDCTCCVYSAIDPVAPATTSATIVRDVIRDSIGFPGPVDERRCLHGRVVGLARRAHPGGARGGLRYGAPLQRQDGRNAGGRRRGAATRGRGRAPGRGRAGARESRRRRSISPRSRAEFFNLMAGVWQPAAGYRMNADERVRVRSRAAGARPPTSRRWWSMSRALKARSTCC